MEFSLGGELHVMDGEYERVQQGNEDYLSAYSSDYFEYDMPHGYFDCKINTGHEGMRLQF